jgi:hypothetical protein
MHIVVRVEVRQRNAGGACGVPWDSIRQNKSG